MPSYIAEILPTRFIGGIASEFTLTADGQLLNQEPFIGAGQFIRSSTYAPDGTFLGAHDAPLNSQVLTGAPEANEVVTLTDGRMVATYVLGPGGSFQAAFRVFDAEGNPLTDFTFVNQGGTFTYLDIAPTPSGGFAILVGDVVGPNRDVVHVVYDANANIVGSNTFLSGQDGMWGFHQEAFNQAVLPDGSFAISYASNIGSPSQGYASAGVRTVFLAPDGTELGTETVYVPSAPAASAEVVGGQPPRTVALADGTIVTFFAWRDEGGLVGANWHVSVGGGGAVRVPEIPAATQSLEAIALPDGRYAVLTGTPVPHLLIMDGTTVVQEFVLPQTDVPQGRSSGDGLFLAPDGTLMVALSGGAVHRFLVTDTVLDLPDNPATAVTGNGISNTALGDGAARAFVLGAGSDLAIGGAGDETMAGGSGFDTLEGGDGADVLDGQAGSDSLLGGAGDDSALGGGGADTILGGDGDDTASGRDGADLLNGGTGDDLLQGNNGSDTALGGDGADTLLGGLGSDELHGGTGNDLLSGQAGFDLMDGGSGDDTLNGNSGADTALGGDGADLLNGGSANDVLEGGAGNDILNGGNGADTVSGGDGDDTLEGNSGSDRLNGGAGNDVLRGGLGADVFVFGVGSGHDRIVDLGNVDTVEIDASLLSETNPVPDDLRNYASFDADGFLVLGFGADSLTFTGVVNTTAVLDDVVFV